MEVSLMEFLVQTQESLDGFLILNFTFYNVF